MEPTQAEFDPVALVSEFMAAFETSKDPTLWVKLIREELAELEDEIRIYYVWGDNKDDLLKEACDLAYVCAGFEIASEGSGLDLSEELMQEALEATRVANRLFSHSVKVEAFRRVHASNMSKLGDDGKPVRREDGKVLKGPNYKPADLSDLV